MATFYAIGVGPGDPELVTRKAERLLRTVSVIVSPVSRIGEVSVAHETIRELLDSERQEIVHCLFPMTTDRALLEPAWQAAAESIAARIQAGLDVAFITIGDPLFYSTFIYLLDIFKSRWPEIAIEIIPGITSFCASAAAGCVPLVEADESFAVVPATAGINIVAEALAYFDTVVLLKVKPLFAEILRAVQQAGRQNSLLFAERVGSQRQLILRDFDLISAHAPDYLSLMIITKPD